VLSSASSVSGSSEPSPDLSPIGFLDLATRRLQRSLRRSGVNWLRSRNDQRPASEQETVGARPPSRRAERARNSLLPMLGTSCGACDGGTMGVCRRCVGLLFSFVWSSCPPIWPLPEGARRTLPRRQGSSHKAGSYKNPRTNDHYQKRHGGEMRKSIKARNQSFLRRNTEGLGWRVHSVKAFRVDLFPRRQRLPRVPPAGPVR